MSSEQTKRASDPQIAGHSNLEPVSQALATGNEWTKEREAGALGPAKGAHRRPHDSDTRHVEPKFHRRRDLHGLLL
jgi:hypothetical protein